ncbi:hypothetical protein [Candidatus Tisiphia endosymbiont of Empis tessellata]|uniref:hypothetical protein n=1 Tax=Candidatus Tisiphia endosymbiont of Empis tessellata TaxID=3066259 RepID=UPI00313EF70C
MLISNIDPNKYNPIFEMHDIVSNKIMELNGDNNKIYLKNIISKLPKFKGSYSGYLWKRAKTILEILLKNSEKYNVDLYAILTLRVELFSLYINLHNASKAQQMFDWFSQKDKEFKLWQMSETQKFYYAKYLGIVGAYYKTILMDFNTAISYFTKALNILDKLDNEADYYAIKLNLLSNLAMTYIFLGEIKISEELFKKIEKLVKSRVMQEDEIYTLYIIKASFFEIQGHYQEALECADKVIEIFIKNGHNINDSYAFTIYMYRAYMLNFLGRYQESYTQVQSLYNSIHNEYEDGDIYAIMARSALGLGKVDQAYEYISNAILLFLAEDKKNAENTN